MPNKPTYEELEKRILELEEKVIKQKYANEEMLRFKAIFENIRVGLYICKLEDINDDKTLKVIGGNQAAADFTGVSIKDIIEKTLDESFPGLREKGIPQLYAEVIRSGEAKILEDLYYGDDRVKYGAFSVKIFPLPNNCVGVSFENITERKQIEKLLIEEKDRAQKYLDISGTMILVLDKDGKVSLVNRKGCQILERNENEIIGKNWFDNFIPEKNRNEVKKIFRQV